MSYFMLYIIFDKSSLNLFAWNTMMTPAGTPIHNFRNVQKFSKDLF